MLLYGKRELIEEQIKRNGAEQQEKDAIQKCSKLIDVMNNKENLEDYSIPDAIADAEIAIEQLKAIHNCYSEVFDCRKAKLLSIKDELGNK